MRETYVDIIDIPTNIITWGNSFDESLEHIKELIICIPGNPGLPSFYVEFLGDLYKNLQGEIPIWIIGHAGHEDPPKSYNHKLPALAENSKIYGLDSQIRYKVEFIKKHVPRHVKIHFIGHSIGAWIILQMLKIELIKNQTQKCYMLFPTIERMAQSPNGKFFKNNIVQYYRVINLFITFICLFPQFIRIILFQIYFWLFSIPTNLLRTTFNLVKPNVMKKIVDLAKEELEVVDQLDVKLIEANKKLLKLYYSTNDGWVPVTYYEDIKKNILDIDAILDSQNIEHAFVLRSSGEMASILYNWINENRL